jgi:hypothetical protein
MTREDQLELCRKAMVQFGSGFWCKPGADFDASGAIFWTGEEALMPDGNVVCYQFLEEFDLYPNYIHKDLEAWAKENGFYFEFYDTCTLLGYKNEP